MRNASQTDRAVTKALRETSTLAKDLRALEARISALEAVWPLRLNLD